MVVVEGVARSLNPSINIWQVAQPVVEEYIKQNVGPKALLRDLAKTARVLARFGPKLPAFVEAQLIGRTDGVSSPAQQNTLMRAAQTVGLVGLGAALALGGVWLTQTYF